MTARTLPLLSALALAAMVATSAGPARSAIEHPRAPVSQGAASVDELIGRFLRALETGDREALRATRVSRAEYLRIIVPGHVPPGAPPKRMSSLLRRWAWDHLNTRSMYYESLFLNSYGGRKLTLDRFEYREGVREYAGYTAYRQLGLFVRDAEGEEHEVRTGSIAEINGKYKFISFIRD